MPISLAQITSASIQAGYNSHLPQPMLVLKNLANVYLDEHNSDTNPEALQEVNMAIVLGLQAVVSDPNQSSTSIRSYLSNNINGASLADVNTPGSLAAQEIQKLVLNMIQTILNPAHTTNSMRDELTTAVYNLANADLIAQQEQELAATNLKAKQQADAAALKDQQLQVAATLNDKEHADSRALLSQQTLLASRLDVKEADEAAMLKLDEEGIAAALKLEEEGTSSTLKTSKEQTAATLVAFAQSTAASLKEKQMSDAAVLLAAQNEKAADLLASQNLGSAAASRRPPV